MSSPESIDPDQVLRVYLDDATNELREEIRRRGEPFPLRVLDSIHTQDMIIALRLRSEAKNKTTK